MAGGGGLRLLVDENVPWPVVSGLIDRGHEVQWVSLTRLGMPDHQIIAEAAPDQVILTQDKDFGDLVYRDGLASHGVILLRLEGMTLPRRAVIVAQTIDELGPRLLEHFTVISHGGIRSAPLRLPPESQGMDS